MNHLSIRPVTNNGNVHYVGLIIEVIIMRRVTVVIAQSEFNIPVNGEYRIKEEFNAISFNRMFEALREFCFYNNSVSLYLFNQIIGTDVHGIVPTQLLIDVNNIIDVPNVNLDDTQR